MIGDCLTWLGSTVPRITVCTLVEKSFLTAGKFPRSDRHGKTPPVVQPAGFLMK
jgi:hypothetical protein